MKHHLAPLLQGKVEELSENDLDQGKVGDGSQASPYIVGELGGVSFTLLGTKGLNVLTFRICYVIK